MKDSFVRPRFVVMSGIKIAAILLAVFCATLFVEAPAFGDGFFAVDGGSSSQVLFSNVGIVQDACNSSPAMNEVGGVPCVDPFLTQSSVTIAPTSAAFGLAGDSGAAQTGSATVQLGSMTGAVQASAVDPAGLGGATAVFTGEWIDTLTVTGAGLPTGAPVSLLFTLNIDTTSTCTGTATSASVSISSLLHVGPSLTPFSLGSTACNTAIAESQQFVYATTVGATVVFFDNVELKASAGFGGEGSASIDPSSGVFIDSGTPGVGYTTASGTNYETPMSSVPEPSSFMLLGTGLLSMTGMALRKKRLA